MAELIFRTEDLALDDIKQLFVETTMDRSIVDQLKAPSPIVLVGSRGVGKSFLLRVAEQELTTTFSQNRVLPIYVSFNRSSLIHSSNPRQFTHWMLAIISSNVLRALRKYGFLARPSYAISVISGGVASSDNTESIIERIAGAFEASWQNPNVEIDIKGLPSIDDFKEAIDEICEEFDIKRFCLLIDEAAHIFRPEQQRQFFSLFRDLRMPRLSCNAAVYPGVTFYGDSFQPTHDATLLNLDREVSQDGYLQKMREIVEKQGETDSDLLKAISRNAQNFNILAYASSGNPRILLKTVNMAPKMNSTQINEVFREFYKTSIWAEHSLLSEKYTGHRQIIDWGRKFIENYVLPDLKEKNDRYLQDDKKTSAFFWIHRDSPHSVKEALRLLTYTGIVIEQAQGIKGTRSEIGTRYQVNLGTLISLESNPGSSAILVAGNLDKRRMSEFGMHHPAYADISNGTIDYSAIDTTSILHAQLQKDIDSLDLASWQKVELRKIGITTIRDILDATEAKLREMYYVGEKRARRIKSAAIASVLEYLSG